MVADALCPRLRPDWSPIDGAVGALAEVGYFATHPVGVAALVLAALSLLWPTPLVRYAALVVVSFALLAEGETLFANVTVAGQLYSEGCRGAPWATGALLIALLGALAWRKLDKRPRV